MRTVGSQWWRVVRQELDLFRRFPRLRFATLGVLFVPALYALIYLSSVWDPNSRSSQLPVGLVNLDTGYAVDGRTVNVGRDLVTSLKQKPTFGYRDYADAEVAREAVRRGDLDFALLIPPRFSAEAVPGISAGAAKLVIYTSEGNNYTGAGFARRFAPEVAHRLNETLNEKRWAVVLNKSHKASDQLGQLRDGLHQLADGSGRLREGSARLAAAQQQLTTGMRQARDAVRTMDARFPAPSDLQRLKDGAHALREGESRLGDGLAQLRAGNQKLVDGAARLRDRSADIWFVGGKVSTAAGQLHDGNAQLGLGLDRAMAGQQQLQDGSIRLDDGVTRLVSGLGQLGDGIHTLATRLPDDAPLQQLDDGARQLAAGNARLDAGVQRILQALPSSAAAPVGSPAGLAASVEPQIEVVAPVANNGIGFAPNFVPVALWIGAVMAGFLLHLRQVPASVQAIPRLPLLLGKLTLPATVVVTQSLVMLAMLLWALDITPPDLPGFVLTLTLTSLVFMSLFMMLVKLFGDTGKAIGLLLLILQMSAAGGLMPVELSNPVFQALHPYMPFTWAVRTFRASLFGAYDGAWLTSWLTLASCGVIALVIAAYGGRWKAVPDRDYGPAMDVE